MERIHIVNLKGQRVCSDEFHKNSFNEIHLPDDFYSMDRKKFCYACAWYLGKPYFDNDLLFEMALSEPDNSLDSDWMPIIYSEMETSDDDDDDFLIPQMVVRIKKKPD